MRWPVNNWELFNTIAGNKFGQQISANYFHSGIDINSNGGGNSDCGIPLIAIADWECTSVHTHETGYGKHLHYKIMIASKEYFVHYAHCKDIYIKIGDKGKEGDILATIGSSGNSDYCHLHFEIKNQPTGIDGIAKTKEDLKKWEDPIKFIEKYFTDSGIIPPSGEEMTSEEKRVFQFIKENQHKPNLESVVRDWFGAYKDLPNITSERDNYKSVNNQQVDMLSSLNTELTRVKDDLNKCLSKPTDAPKSTTEAFSIFLRLLFR